MEARKTLSDFIESGITAADPELGQLYRSSMNEYRQNVVLRDNLENNLKLRPGQLDREGNISGGTQESALRGIEGAFSSDSMVAASRLDALEALERVTGHDDLVPPAMGAIAHSWTGGGLLVRNELAQMARLIVGLQVSSLTSLPAFILFSPRLTSEGILRLAGPVSAASGKVDQAAGFAKKKLQAVEQHSQRISETMNRLNELTNGELRTRAIREGWNITQLMERFELQEQEERE